jgi:ABC-type glycerol-3-phosphate transport system substrate-binding protein
MQQEDIMSDESTGRISRRAFLKAALVTGAGTALAACTAAPPAAAPAAPTEAPAAPKEEAPAAEAPASPGLSPDALTGLTGKHKLVWWSWTPQKNDSIMKVLPGISRMYPSLEIELERRNLDWSQYPQMVKTSLAAGNAPDIIDIYEAAVSTMDLAAGGQLVDLKPYLDLDTEWKNALIPSALKADSWNSGTHFFSMPISVNNVMVWYNKTIFEKVGIEIPKTLDELKAAAKKLRDASVQPFVFGVKDQWQAGDMFLTLAAQIAGDVMRKADTRQAKWNDPALIETMAAFKDLQDSGILADGITGIGSGDSGTLYFAEKVAMMLNGSWVLSGLDQWPEGLFDRTGVFLFPQVKAGATPVAVGDYSQNGGIWSGSKEQAAALAMYRFLSIDKEAQSIWLPLGEMPVIPWDTSSVAEPVLKTFIEAQPAAFTRMIYDSQANQALLSGVQGMLEGKVTPEQVMDTTEQSARTGALPFLKD